MIRAVQRIAIKLRAPRAPAQGRWTKSVPRQGHNTPLPLKRSPPGSFKRLLGGPSFPFQAGARTSSMDHSQDLDTLFVHTVDDAVGGFEDFANIRLVILGHGTSGFRKCLDLSCPIPQPPHDEMRVKWGGLRDEFVDAVEVCDGRLGPDNLHLDRANRARTSSWG